MKIKEIKNKIDNIKKVNRIKKVKVKDLEDGIKNMSLIDAAAVFAVGYIVGSAISHRASN